MDTQRDVLKAQQSQSMLFNRELSWIEFNSRVLDEALDPSLPLLERLKFLSIFSTNTDEFFMVRVSGLQEQLEQNPPALSPDGLTPKAQLAEICRRLHVLIQRQTDCLLGEVLPGLEKLGVKILAYSELSPEQRESMQKLFYERVFPVLTPLAVDPGHPFPYISNISLNLGVLLAAPGDPVEDKPRFARVKLPPNVPRLIPLDGRFQFILLEDLIRAHIASLFPQCSIL